MQEFLDLEDRIKLGIRIGESHYREFKSAWDGPPGHKSPRKLKEVLADVGRTLVAFANADGGELLIGVEDDGSVTGIPYDEPETSTLLAASETHVHHQTPLPSPRKTKLLIDGKLIAYFQVAKGAEFVHLTSDGRCLKRIDRDSIPISSEDIVTKRLEDKSRVWDRSIQEGATLNDLDIDLVQSVASQIAYGISAEKCLQYLDLAEFTPSGLKIKRGAVLLFGKDVRRWHPRCQVRILTIEGKEKRSGENLIVLKDDIVAENLVKLVDLSWERLTSALHQYTRLTKAARFEQNLLYPQIACREALINAIVHRNYAIEGRGIEISIFQDRMEINNPGMLLSTISIEDIRALKGAHESRNPLIARVLREIGFVREMGEGIRRIYEVMKSSALAAPVIASDNSGFTVTLFHKSLYEPLVNLWLSNYDSHSLTENERAVLALGYDGRSFSTQDVIDRLGIVDTDQVRQLLTPLRAKGLIEKLYDKNQIFRESQRARVPKREVKVWRVAPADSRKSGGELLINQGVTEIEDDLTRNGDTHAIFVGGLPYSTGKADIMNLFPDNCEVIEITLPANPFRPAQNKGFAFVTVAYNGSTNELLNLLEGKRIGVRRLSFRLARLGTAREDGKASKDGENKGGFM